MNQYQIPIIGSALLRRRVSERLDALSAGERDECGHGYQRAACALCRVFGDVLDGAA